MKSLLSRGAVIVFALFVLGCITNPKTPLVYSVDLNDRDGDTFKVTLTVNDLGPDNAIYQFASTAPGTYQTMDIGRFVRSFEAFDEAGNLISSEQISTNQWEISAPERVAEIRYVLAETWDTQVEEHRVYPMAGTSIEDDHVLINGQAVFGYPTGMQARPLKIWLEYPESWMVGTALNTDESGYYVADDYDHVVDSPILLGRLSHAALNVRGADIEVYTYSKTDKIHSSAILESVTDILNAAGDFLIELPVDRYAFLFHFEDFSAGAWEHSFSSEYVFAESDLNEATLSSIRSIVAHEFFHIVTPLNIHSEIIEYFDFVEPVASEHVWLYEGTTEWIAHASQLRGGLIDLDEYLSRLSGKMRADDQFDKEYSLSQLSLESHSDKGQQQWGNIYQRGALVAGLLDVKLLELSGGTRGLREVIIDLSKRYGPDKPFDDATFFDEFAKFTYPEIRPFFDDYVRDTQPLPMAEYYTALGIRYEPEVKTGEKVVELGLSIGVDGEDLFISQASDIVESCGMQTGDVIVGFNQMSVTLRNAQQAFGELHALGANETFTMKVRRGEDEFTYTCAKQLIDEVRRHVFTVDPDATEEQIRLREIWVTNL